jgi:hypothetical protein
VKRSTTFTNNNIFAFILSFSFIFHQNQSVHSYYSAVKVSSWLPGNGRKHPGLFLFQNLFHPLNDLRVLVVHVHFFFWVVSQVIKRTADRLCSWWCRGEHWTRKSANGEQPFFFPKSDKTGSAGLVDHIIAIGGFVRVPGKQVAEKTKTVHPMSVVGPSQ